MTDSEETLQDKINGIFRKYGNDLDEVWQSTDTEQRNKLARAFRAELEQEWPYEFKYFMIKKVFDASSERVITSIKMAYIFGYMVGNGWISVQELADLNLFLGDSLQDFIRSNFKNAKTKGIAFAASFSRVSTEGTQMILSYNIRHPEPLKYDILNEILLKEGAKLIGKSIKHPELLCLSSNITINPFNPSDHEYLTQAFLAGPSRLGHFDPEKLEVILKKLLKDDYDSYYETAKKQINNNKSDF
jgi:hypothetical protein